ncbi:MAG: hypothetical protein FWG25_01540 [Promicromonosporaceae bacterium]|nr:hypothetical protein [Promicromonosporaceae bacterium]
MPDVLVRGLSRQALDHWTEKAKDAGISRNTAMQQVLEAPVAAQPERRAATAEDWARTGRVFADLGNEEIMAQAWR